MEQALLFGTLCAGDHGVGRLTRGCSLGRAMACTPGGVRQRGLRRRGRGGGQGRPRSNPRGARWSARRFPELDAKRRGGGTAAGTRRHRGTYPTGQQGARHRRVSHSCPRGPDRDARVTINELFGGSLPSALSAVAFRSFVGTPVVLFSRSGRGWIPLLHHWKAQCALTTRRLPTRVSSAPTSEKL